MMSEKQVKENETTWSEAFIITLVFSSLVIIGTALTLALIIMPFYLADKYNNGWFLLMIPLWAFFIAMVIVKISGMKIDEEEGDKNDVRKTS